MQYFVASFALNFAGVFLSAAPSPIGQAQASERSRKTEEPGF